MPFDIDPIYAVYLFVALAAGLTVEAVYLLFFSSRGYRKKINRRLQLMEGQPDREGILVQLRRERGLSGGGDYRLPLVALNRLILQSGVTIGLPKLAIYIGVGTLIAFAAVMFLRDSFIEATFAALFC